MFFLKLFPAFATRFFIFRLFDSAQNDKIKRAQTNRSIKASSVFVFERTLAVRFLLFYFSENFGDKMLHFFQSFRINAVANCFSVYFALYNSGVF